MICRESKTQSQRPLPTETNCTDHPHSRSRRVWYWTAWVTRRRWYARFAGGKSRRGCASWWDLVPGLPPTLLWCPCLHMRSLAYRKTILLGIGSCKKLVSRKLFVGKTPERSRDWMFAGLQGCIDRLQVDLYFLFSFTFYFILFFPFLPLSFFFFFSFFFFLPDFSFDGCSCLLD